MRCRLPGRDPHDSRLDYFRIADNPLLIRVPKDGRVQLRVDYRKRDKWPAARRDSPTPIGSARNHLIPRARQLKVRVSSLYRARDAIDFISVQRLGGDNPGEMASRGDESSDVTVLEHDGVMFAPDAVHGGIHHGPRQVVSANHLVWEQEP
jgi:hypothetical protein